MTKIMIFGIKLMPNCHIIYLKSYHNKQKFQKAFQPNFTFFFFGLSCDFILLNNLFMNVFKNVRFFNLSF